MFDLFWCTSSNDLTYFVKCRRSRPHFLRPPSKREIGKIRRLFFFIMNPKFRVMHVVKRKHIQKDKIQLTVKKIRGKWIELGKQENPEIAHRSQFFSIFFLYVSLSLPNFNFSSYISPIQLSKKLGWNNRYKDLKYANSLKAAQPSLYFRLPSWAIDGWLEKNYLRSPNQIFPQSLFKVRPCCYDWTDD